MRRDRHGGCAAASRDARDLLVLDVRRGAPHPAGTFALGVRRGILARSPVDGPAPSERPKQRNKTRVEVLDAETMWDAIDLDAGTLTVSRSMLPDGTAKAPKTDAGMRTVPLLPALRRTLIEWKLEAPHTAPSALVIATAAGKPVAERNLRRALDHAKTGAGLDATDGRLSMHSLRHSFASMLATDLELPATTLARLTGHADAGFTLRVSARDGRDEATVVDDVLRRASGAGVGV